MSTTEKVERVSETKGSFGLNRSLAVLGLPKSTWYYRRTQQVDYETKYTHLRPDLEEIARRCPALPGAARSTATGARRRRCTRRATPSTRKWSAGCIRAGI